MAEPYLAAKIKARIVFDGSIVFEDVVSVSATFALNSIPTASVIVAVGKSFSKGVDKIATIHKERPQIKPRMKAAVFVNVTQIEGGPTNLIEVGEYKVFEGYVAGVGYQRSATHANYVINLIHWLDDLNNSSAINGNWFPGVPHDWAQQACFDTIGGGGKVSSFSGVPAISAATFDATAIRRDLWGQAIKPVFETIAGFPSGAVQARQLPPAAQNAIVRNSAALSALARMPGASPGAVALALAIGQGAAADDNLANSIKTFFQNSIGESFVQHTFWSKLINEFAAQFFFAISPAVEWATPIPFCAGVVDLGLGPQSLIKEIAAKEYAYANLNANMSQIIEAVHVYHPLASATNLPTGPIDQRISFYRPWAQWPPTNPNPGLKLFKNAPSWMGDLKSHKRAVQNTMMWRRDCAPRQGGARPPNTGTNTATAHKTAEHLAENLAKHWYYTEILQQRYGEFSGPLRFDIAPGSIVRIMTPPRDKALEPGITPYMIASVVSVSYVINSERAGAGTAFTIAHQKTDAESKDALYAVNSPPLYDKPWFGGPLTIKK